MIELKDVSKFFKYKKKIIKAVYKINLHICRGDMVSIIGDSGSGKTTTLNLIGGIYNPNEGEYLYNGTLLPKSESGKAKFRNENIGFILQNHALIQKKNVMYNISLPLIYSGMPKEEIKERIISISKYFGIYNKLEMYPYMLSGGECQRVSIARAVVNNPKVILADEPTSSLDGNRKKEVLDLLKKLNDKGMTVIIATHDKDVEQHCNHIITMSNGEVLNISHESEGHEKYL